MNASIRRQMLRRDPRLSRMRRFAGLATLGLGFAFSAAALAQEKPSGGAPMSPGWTFGEQGGAALYDNICAACHQPDAKGASGAGAYPALAANANLASAPYATSVVLHGLRGMPPIGLMMSDAQVADAINYVRSHFGNRYDDPVSAADVKAAR
jgi:mono/diheme cytochrome c family protein